MNLFPLWSNTAFKLTLDESMTSLHCPEVCSGAIFPLILECYFSALDHHPLSNTLVCLTASSYTMTVLHVPQEDSTA